MSTHLSRRTTIRLEASGGAVAGAAALPHVILPTPATPGTPTAHHQSRDDMASHPPGSTVGDVDLARLSWDPSACARTFDYGETTTMQDGAVVREWEIIAGDAYTCEFHPKPFDGHLHHCHASPMQRHIHKGLHGAFIVNPEPKKHEDHAQQRHPDDPGAAAWQEIVTVMNALDAANEAYAANSIDVHSGVETGNDDATTAH